MDKIILDRSTYKRIKSMSKTQLEEFLMDFSVTLLNDSKVLDTNDLKADLSKIDGIGEKRLSKIMEVIANHTGVYHAE